MSPADTYLVESLVRGEWCPALSTTGTDVDGRDLFKRTVPKKPLLTFRLRRQSDGAVLDTKEPTP